MRERRRIRRFLKKQASTGPECQAEKSSLSADPNIRPVSVRRTRGNPPSADTGEVQRTTW